MHSQVLAIICSTVFTSDHPRIVYEYLGSRVALLPGKFFAHQASFCTLLAKNVNSGYSFRVFRMAFICLDYLKTSQTVSKTVRTFPDVCKTARIFPIDFKIFQMVSKLSGPFLIVSRLSGRFKTFRMVQNCPDLSSWLQNLLDGLKAVRIFLDSFKTFRTVQNCPDLSGWLQNFPDGFKTVLNFQDSLKTFRTVSKLSGSLRIAL